MIVKPIDVSDYPKCIIPTPSDTPDRSPGIHLTTIIRDMANVAGIGKDSGFNDEDLNWYAAGGWLWERVWDQAHSGAIIRGDITSPGEFQCDGIYMTPDRVDWTRPAVIELKVRWKSAYKFDSLEKEFWAEVTQVKSYCYALGILEADLVVFFVAGNWRPPVPEVRGVNLRFTEMELEEGWRGIVSHARYKGWIK